MDDLSTPMLDIARQMEAEWQAAADHWRDRTANYFERTYWLPLAETTLAYIHALRALELARRVRLALVVVEEDAGASVKLAHHDTLCAVDDEGPVLGHERDLTEVDLLLLDVADGLL